MTQKISHLRDLTQQPGNPRRHNPRNIGLIVAGLHEVGAARSGVIDENGVILAGNGTYEALAEAGIERVKVIEADGDEWVVVKRSGLSEEQKRRLAYYDNRAGDLSDWEAEQVLADLDAGLDLTGMFSDGELNALLQTVAQPAPPEKQRYDLTSTVAGDTAREPGDEAPANSTSVGLGEKPRYPLAIVLTRSELALWNKAKKALKVRADKACLLRLLQEIGLEET